MHSVLRCEREKKEKEVPSCIDIPGLAISAHRSPHITNV